VVLEAGYAAVELPAIALYDNVLDPQQRQNLADLPAWRETRDDLLARLEAWMVATDDPLLGGDVPLPPGARVNDPGSSTFSEDLLQADAAGNVHRVPNPQTIR
jgi:hypothetical protein